MKKTNRTISGFVDFIRKQDVVTFSVAFILGGSVSNLVGSLTRDIINPITSALLGKAGGLDNFIINFGSNKIMIGNFVGAVLNFIFIAFIVYLVFKVAGLEKLDIKEEKDSDKLIKA